MSFPVGSEQPAAAIAALDAPSTLRNSRRFTPAVVVSWVMSVVAVRAVVPRLLSLTRVEGVVCRATTRRCGERRAGRLVGVTGGRETFFRTVAADVTAHAPTHVQRGALLDPMPL